MKKFKGMQFEAVCQAGRPLCGDGLGVRNGKTMHKALLLAYARIAENELYRSRIKSGMTQNRQYEI